MNKAEIYCDVKDCLNSCIIDLDGLNPQDRINWVCPEHEPRDDERVKGVDYDN